MGTGIQCCRKQRRWVVGCLHNNMNVLNAAELCTENG